ncbi:response regulator transcription factor [Intestinibacter bartlettii]|uniref:Heme response regulator HssR n=1 Tax=Intestinibacter bartlettii TaxID=261299 RepID=A0ABS6DSU5_9FIRM|nr:response regulator transcription factor [Intestinibacter bartlettii]MBU5334911.1 response regulator transcription factor [Intestinibacter bartlettii]MDO5010901.1 response regulator transcription factor [Intestinibacter bartlettii]
MFNILVIEDNKNMRKLICATLKQNGYSTFEAEDGEVGLDVLDTTHIDLIICDIMMPNMDGYEFTETLREGHCEIPIIIVTAKEQLEDKKKGFSIGADDYMVKPIDFEELILRIGAILRRSKIVNDHKITVGDTILDYNSLSVTSNGECNTLPKKEFYLLFKLVSSPDTIFTRRQLLDEIWGMESMADERTVDVHIKRIRERYRDSKDFEIVTVRGLGYKAVINS